jgi:DNA mismatch endonuclease, patch repair protein
MAEHELRRRDSLSPADRSKRMSLVRAKENRSTEKVVESALRRARIFGWRKHQRSIAGCPDFYFKRPRVALFVDGCFWHGCSRCGRRMPATRAAFWKDKIIGNRRRDQRVRRALVQSGCAVVRVWEHELNTGAWLHRLRKAVSVGDNRVTRAHG